MRLGMQGIQCTIRTGDLQGLIYWVNDGITQQHMSVHQNEGDVATKRREEEDGGDEDIRGTTSVILP